MKKIWPWLLLLLLLIIFCVWSKKDSIQANSSIHNHSLASVPVNKEQYIEYVIEQTNTTEYTLNGNFTNMQQQSQISDLFIQANKQLIIDKTQTSETIKDTGIIALTNKIIPHFIKTYENGKIVYQNQRLTISGTAKSEDAQHTMQDLLHSSTITTLDNSTVDMTISSIEYQINKNVNNVHAIGTFGDNNQISTIKQHLPEKSSTNFKIKPHYIDNGSLPIVEEFLPFFLEKYIIGNINYRDNKLTISGNVHSQDEIEKAKQLLSNTGIAVVNNTQIDPEILAKEKARLEEEARKAEAKRLAALEAQRRAEAEEKARLEEEARKAELKNKLDNLLKMENIEFHVNKSTLTSKGLDTVNKLVVILHEYTSVNIEIAGHTDSDGSAEYNQNLSQSRVDTIKRKLIEQGINESRLTAKGYGETKPLLPNTTHANKAKNRRVEINIIGE